MFNYQFGQMKKKNVDLHGNANLILVLKFVLIQIWDEKASIFRLLKFSLLLDALYTWYNLDLKWWEAEKGKWCLASIKRLAILLHFDNWR